MKHPSALAIRDFTYELPPEKIAAYPLEKRDEAKLLVFKEQNISESTFKHLGDFLKKNTLLVFNNARVIQARLRFLTSKNKVIELFCLEPGAAYADLSIALAQQGNVRWRCLAGNLKHWKEEETLQLAEKDLRLEAKLAERKTGYVEVEFSWAPATLSFAEVLELAGSMPIPPYLKRESDATDAERYQTVYAEKKGSVAAPTAGLHFTGEVFKSLQKKNIDTLTLTLHVGAGTFKPVKSETLQEHDMHAEWLEVNGKAITELLHHKGGVVAVGTTSLRTLETLYWMGVKAFSSPQASLSGLEIGQWDPYNLPGNVTVNQSLTALVDWLQRHHLERIICRTQILIAPPYGLKVAAGLITNFHQPQSTLLLLISAIVGNKWKELYDYALTHNFRFLSYGDSSLLLK